MNKLFIITLIICQPLVTVGQNTDQLAIGIADSIYSEVLDENRRVLVHLPYNINDTIASRKKYPLLYLLDGPKHMWTVVGLLRYRSGWIDLFPNMIVVGIENTNRLRDFTPTVTDNFPAVGNIPEDAITGGGENFTIFLEHELIPFIDDKYPTSPYRTLIGGSLAGLLVINTLLITQTYLTVTSLLILVFGTMSRNY